MKVSLHDEEDTYLPAFRAAVIEGKADSVMCAYNSINGQPACANQFLLHDTLRGAWKFDGYVVSDCGAIGDINGGHAFTASLAESAALSLKRGTDNDCGAGDAHGYLEAMQKGLISREGTRRQSETHVQGPLPDGPVRSAVDGEVRADPRFGSR